MGLVARRVAARHHLRRSRPKQTPLKMSAGAMCASGFLAARSGVGSRPGQVLRVLLRVRRARQRRAAVGHPHVHGRELGRRLLGRRGARACAGGAPAAWPPGGCPPGSGRLLRRIVRDRFLTDSGQCAGGVRAAHGVARGRARRLACGVGACAHMGEPNASGERDRTTFTERCAQVGCVMGMRFVRRMAPAHDAM